METTTEIPRAWVGCLACYNEGRLTGDWVDGTDAKEFVPCRRAGHEEWWVFDHEGYAGLLPGECSPTEAQAAAETLDSLPPWIPPAAFGAWAEATGGEEISEFEDTYQGEWEELEDYAREFADDIGAIPDDARWPLTCIDWEHAARELSYDLTVIDRPDGGVWIFRA